MRTLIALAFLTLFPSFISTQQESYSRSYFSSIVQNDAIYILGGSNTTLDVPVLNITNGLDINSIGWNVWSVSNTSELAPFTRGVAYKGYNNQIYVQAGEGSTFTLESVVNFDIGTGHFTNTSVLGIPPPATFMMTATVDRSSNIAYYYGGEIMFDHGMSIESTAINTFYQFDTTQNTWSSVNPLYTNATRPSRNAHTSNIINSQIFIMGGITYGANATSEPVEADFESLLVYDIASNTAVSVTTLGDIPVARQAYSTALGLDGRSIVIYGGYIYDGTSNYNPATSDIYILDTCTLTWRKQSVGGNAPGALFGHGAVNINNYMIVLMGLTNPSTYNLKAYILDMNQWKWVDSLTNTVDTIASGTCQFVLPNINSTDYVDFNYDYSVLANPLTPASSNNTKNEGFGIGSGFLALIIIGVVAYFYRIKHNRRNNKKSLNPRWMRNVTNDNNSNDRDYPLFVYNKELDHDNTNNPNRRPIVNNNEVRTYTASDHEQWEQQLNEEAENSHGRHSDIWKRMRGLNDAPVVSDEQVEQNHYHAATTYAKLLDV